MDAAGPRGRDIASRPPRHLGAGAALSVAADVGTLASATVLSVVLARTIGPSANGTYALVLTVINMAVLLFSLGLSAGITYQVSRRRWPPQRAFSASYRAALVLGVAGVATSLGFYAIARDGALRAVDSHLAIIGLAAIPALLAAQFAAAILLARDRYEAYAGLQLTTAAVVLFAGAGLAVPFGLTGAVAGLAASAVITAVAGAAMLRRPKRTGSDEEPPNATRGGERGHLEEAFRFGLQAWVANLLQQANYRLDLLVLGAYAAVSNVGVYSVAVTITAIGWILPHGLQTVVFPRTATLDAAAVAGEVTLDESDAAVARAARHSVLLLLPAGLIVAVLLGLVPLIYGSKFNETVALGFILLPGVLALGVGKVLGSVVSGRGKPRYMLYSGVIGAGVTVALYFVLIPPYAEWGASAASCLSYLITTAIVVGFFRRVTRIPLRVALVPTRADIHNYSEAIESLRAHLRTRLRRRIP